MPSARALVHAAELDSSVSEWFTAAIPEVPRVVDVLAVGRDLQRAQTEQAAAEALAAYVENADALDRVLFQRGLSARQRRVEEVAEKVRHLSAHLTRLPAGGSLLNVWNDLEPLERRHVVAGFLEAVVVTRGADSGDLPGHVEIRWADGSIADDKGRVAIAAA
jgi:hypothetical protein